MEPNDVRDRKRVVGDPAAHAPSDAFGPEFVFIVFAVRVIDIAKLLDAVAECPYQPKTHHDRQQHVLCVGNAAQEGFGEDVEHHDEKRGAHEAEGADTELFLAHRAPIHAADNAAENRRENKTQKDRPHRIPKRGSGRRVIFLRHSD